MKKLLFLCVFVLGLTTQIQAQDNSEFKQETVEFIKLTGAGEAFENAIAQIGFKVSDANKKAYKEEANATLIDLYE